MAFETFSENFAGAGGTPGRRTRRIMYVVSAVVHGIAVVAAIAYSFWHVEEVTPPRVAVTFMSIAAPPPPPPPPPPLGGGTAVKRHVKTPASVMPPTIKVPEVVQPRPPEVEPKRVEAAPAVAPPRPSSDEASAAGQKATAGAPPGAGVPEGAKGGVAGGVIGGAGIVRSPAASPPSRFLPPQMGAQQKVSGADPDFPATLRTAGARYQVKAKVCVGSAGAVDSVVVLKHAHPTLDGNVVNTVKTWRFRPLMANGNPLPFCYFANFDFSSE